MYCMYVCVSLCVCISYVCLTVHVFHDSRFTTKMYLENFLDAMHTIERISNCKIYLCLVYKSNQNFILRVP